MKKSSGNCADKQGKRKQCNKWLKSSELLVFHHIVKKSVPHTESLYTLYRYVETKKDDVKVPKAGASCQTLYIISSPVIKHKIV